MVEQLRSISVPSVGAHSQYAEMKKLFSDNDLSWEKVMALLALVAACCVGRKQG